MQKSGVGRASSSGVVLARDIEGEVEEGKGLCIEKRGESRGNG